MNKGAEDCFFLQSKSYRVGGRLFKLKSKSIGASMCKKNATFHKASPNIQICPPMFKFVLKYSNLSSNIQICPQIFKFVLKY